MPTRKVYWVVPSGMSWEVKHDGRVLSRHYHKDNAVAEARHIAKANAPSQVKVMRRDGTIETEFTYEMDPYPPVG